MAFIRKNSPYEADTLLIGGSDMVLGGNKCTIITNSGIMKIGDAITVTAAAAGNGIVTKRYGTAGDIILGICKGFGQLNGKVVNFDSGTNDTVTVASNNETVAMIYAILDVTLWAVWSAPLSAAVHTTAAAGFGTYFDPDTTTNAGRILESSATRTFATGHGRGFACVGIDPDDTTRVLVLINESFRTGAGA